MRDDERVVFEIGAGWIIALIIALAILAAIAVLAPAAHGQSYAYSTHPMYFDDNPKALAELTQPHDQHQRYAYLAGKLVDFSPHENFTQVIVNSPKSETELELVRVNLCGDLGGVLEPLDQANVILAYTLAASSKQTNCRNLIAIHRLRNGDEK